MRQTNSSMRFKMESMKSKSKLTNIMMIEENARTPTGKKSMIIRHKDFKLSILNGWSDKSKES